MFPSRRTIGEYCQVGDGAHASLKRVGTGIPYLTAKNLKDGAISDEKVDFINEHTFEKHFKIESKAISRPKPGDVIFGIIGSLGQAYLVRQHDHFGISSSVAVLRPKTEQVLSKFLYYWVTGPTFQSALYSIKGGVAQSYISLEMLRSLPLSVPSLTTQHRIASILSAYDDLIENNTRRIAILEEMARRIYDEWFVRFRFPGHEQVKMVESELGLIPEGWQTSFPDHVDFLEGPGLRNWQYRDAGVPFLNIRTLVSNDIDLGKVQFIEEEEVRQRYQHFLLSAYDHVVSSSGTLGRIVTVQSFHLPLMLNTSIIRMRPIGLRVGRWLLKSFLRSGYFQNQIHAVAIGAAQKNFGPSHLKTMWILAPDETTAQRFEDLVGPMEELILSLVRKNRNLRMTRDLLLPKLISGELDVSNMPEPEDIAA